MNRITRWWYGTPASPPQPDPVDANVDQALRLTQEVRDLIRERAQSAHPFRRVLGDLLFRQPSVVDVALIADAYEMTQESRIFHGPNGGAVRKLRNQI